MYHNNHKNEALLSSLNAFWLLQCFDSVFAEQDENLSVLGNYRQQTYSVKTKGAISSLDDKMMKK